MMFRLALRTLLVLILSWSAACRPSVGAMTTPTASSTPTSTTTATSIPFPSPAPSLTPEPPDTGWQLLQAGLERRMIRLFNEENQHIESLYLYRLDQDQFRLDIAYHETPQDLEAWRQETEALLIVNGGFFRVEGERYIPNGLTIIHGQTIGSTYESFGGMLAVHAGRAELRWLAQKPYDLTEPLQAALQSFPLLVKPGGELGFPAELEDHVQARRTVIAQDRDDRILFLVAPRGYFTLHQLSLYLTESDLDLEVALNLDGGPSTGILVASPPEVIPSQTVLPVVILVYPRG